MKIDLDEIRARVQARVQAAADRRRALHEAGVREIVPRALASRPRGLGLARILPWRRRPEDHGPQG